jgi:hypothetical protein
MRLSILILSAMFVSFAGFANVEGEKTAGTEQPSDTGDAAKDKVETAKNKKKPETKPTKK